VSPPSFIVINEKKLTSQSQVSRNKPTMLRGPMAQGVNQPAVVGPKQSFKTKLVNVSLKKN
jgi:hypothetical protein